ncbi:MAG: hypothetical protein H6581_24685 [Bacteroidia bacterium]|nr:hypothetical protein [Bacteroidia bacterium]
MELDPNGGTNYSLFGTKQLLSVPYALYANQVTSTGVNDYAFFQEKLTSGLPAGPFIAGQWQTRNLNTTLAINGSSIQRLNSTISMAPGTYEIRASAPGFVVKYHKARLQDVTHNITLLEGTSEYVNTSYGHQTRSFVEGIITIPSTIDFQLQHYCSSTWNSNGMGVASNFTGQAEIYSIIYIRRIN